MQSIHTLYTTIKEDLQAHRGEWSRPGFHTIATHRFGNWAKTIETRLLRAPVMLVAKTANVFCRNVYGIELPFEVVVGRHVIFEHQSGVVIHGNAKIGDKCVIRQNVTLGIKDVRRPMDAPELSTGVDVGAGAKILGKIWVGSYARIGANSVVVKDVGPNRTVVGAPARVVVSQELN